MDIVIHRSEPGCVPEIRGITIDGPASRDLDDAIWLERAGPDTRIQVSIADVAAAVPKSSELDADARKIGFTRYFAEGNRPMLPRGLSENALSLLPGEPRRVICIDLTLDAELELSRVEVSTAQLRSAAKLSFSEVAGLLDEKGRSRHDSPVRSALRPIVTGFAAVAAALLDRRRRRGELAFYDLNRGWALTEEGGIRKLSRVESNIGYVVVQEFMILTNRAVAEMLALSGATGLFRNHQARAAAPDRDELLRDLNEALMNPDAHDIDVMRRRMNLIMSRALYEPAIKGHYGLNLPAYVHFTSPIRRYADLVNHRVLRALLQCDSPPYSRDELSEIGEHLNRLTEAEAERKSGWFKERAKREATLQTGASAERIASLENGMAYQMLVSCAALPNIPETVIKGMTRRIHLDRISPKEVFGLLFQTPVDREGWRILRHRAVRWLGDRRFHAVSLASMGPELLGWKDVQFRIEGKGTSFTGRASAVVDGRKVETGVHSGSSKKAVREWAAVELCCLLCGEAPPARAPDELPKEGNLCVGVQSVGTSGAERAIDEHPKECSARSDAAPRAPRGGRPVDWARLKPYLDREDFVSALFQARTWFRANIKKPRTMFRSEIVGESEIFYCSLTLEWDGRTYEHESPGTSRNVAKQAAARVLLDQMRSTESVRP